MCGSEGVREKDLKKIRRTREGELKGEEDELCNDLVVFMYLWDLNENFLAKLPTRV
jgi:hypothetical protein